jgi:hypothetical protein
MPKFTLTVNDNGVRKRVVVESATEPTEAEVLAALREDHSFLSDSDLRALKRGDYSSISDQGLLALKSKQTSSQSTNRDVSHSASGTNRSEMRKYTITDPETGRKIQLTRDTLPTEQELVEIFKSNLEPDGTITSPSGQKYKWSKPNPPTEADFKAIADYESAQGITGKTVWWDTSPPGFREVNGESTTGLTLFSPSGRRFQWTNSTPLNQSDIDQLGRLKTESVGTIKNSPEASTLLRRNSTSFFLTGWVVSLLATFAVSWILARRKYNRKSEGAMTTIQEAESNPATFRRASLGVRRLASTLFWLLTVGSILIGITISDFRFTASLGLIIGFFSWVLIRGIDWIIRGFKFGG